MKRYLPFVITAGFLVITVGTGVTLFVWKQRSPVTAKTGPGKPGAEPPHRRGSANARVRVEEFGDFQCPSCAALSPALNQAEQKYQGNVCVIFRQFPLAAHPHALEVARASEAAGLQGHFWEMHDLLYGSQLIWIRANNIREFLNQFAKSLGLDVERFRLDMDSERVTARISADQQRAASVSVDRTPAIFINDRRVPDSSLNQGALREAIEAAVNQKSR